MQPMARMPAAFGRYAAIGGAMTFAVFDDADPSPEAAADAIVAALDAPAAARAALLAAGSRRLGRDALFGDWYDPVRRRLVRRGTWRTDTGETLTDPPLAALADVRIVSGGSTIPVAGAGGQFAYAFAFPPYALAAPPGEVQALFDEVCAVILPRGMEAEIHDWSGPHLPAVSDWFAAGMEWWGVFLFTIHLPALRRLTVAMASATD